MNRRITETTLRQQGERHAGTGGASEGNRDLGFRPAFFDFATCTVYPSRFRDGRAAPVHLLEGLPDDVVLIRDAGGRVLAAKSSLIVGFVRGGFFYTRAAAARAVADWRLLPHYGENTDCR